MKHGSNREGGEFLPSLITRFICVWSPPLARLSCVCMMMNFEFSHVIPPRVFHCLIRQYRVLQPAYYSIDENYFWLSHPPCTVVSSTCMYGWLVVGSCVDPSLFRESSTNLIVVFLSRCTFTTGPKRKRKLNAYVVVIGVED